MDQADAQSASDSGSGSGSGSAQAIRRWRGWAILRYTALRLGILLACWALIQWVTGLRGLLAAALAVVVSGAISLVLLSRQRDAFSMNVFGFLRRINERIEASARAEDEPDEQDAAQLPGSTHGEQDR